MAEPTPIYDAARIDALVRASRLEVAVGDFRELLTVVETVDDVLYLFGEDC